SLPGPHHKALLEQLDLPFNLSLSRQLKPLKADVPALSARIMGIPFSGRLGFDASKESPVSAALKAPATRISTLRPLLERYGLAASSGTAAVSLELSGSSLQRLDATARVQLAEVQGTQGKNSLAVKQGDLTAKVNRGSGHLLIQGKAQIKAFAFNGKGGDA